MWIVEFVCVCVCVLVHENIDEIKITVNLKNMYAIEASTTMKMVTRAEEKKNERERKKGNEFNTTTRRATAICCWATALRRNKHTFGKCVAEPHKS